MMLKEKIHLPGGLEGRYNALSGPGYVHEDRVLKNRSALLPEQIPNTHRFRPLCVLWIGRRGEGKSLSMSATAQIQRKRYIAANVNQQIFSNYWLDFADLVTPYLVDELIQFPPWGKNAFITLDEIGATFPSRRAMAGVSVNFATWMTQIRKRNCEIQFTTQFPQVLDGQILLQVDLFIRCRAVRRDRAGHVLSVLLECHDYWGQWTGNDARKPWPPRPEWADWYVRYDQLNNMWSHYNTDQVTPPYWIANRDSVISQQGWEQDNDFDWPAEDLPPIEEGEKAAATLDELISLAGDTVNVMALLRYAREYDSKISRIVLAELMERQGYAIDRRGPWMGTK